MPRHAKSSGTTANARVNRMPSGHRIEENKMHIADKLRLPASNSTTNRKENVSAGFNCSCVCARATAYAFIKATMRRDDDINNNDSKTKKKRKKRKNVKYVKQLPRRDETIQFLMKEDELTMKDKKAAKNRKIFDSNL